MKFLDKLAVILLLVGGLNWGLVALLKFDLVSWVSMGKAFIDTGLKVLVGAAAVWGIFKLKMLK